MLWTKTKSLFYSYWIFQLHLMLSITRFFFHVSKLPLASALPLSSGFDHTFWYLQKSVHGCQQFCFLFISSYVSYSTGLSAGTCAVCFVLCSTFRYHSKSLSQPSAFCRQHPTSKINSTKWRAKPYTWPATMHRWHKSMDVQQPAQTKWG